MAQAVAVPRSILPLLGIYPSTTHRVVPLPTSFARGEDQSKRNPSLAAPFLTATNRPV
jgi:hypothetical protein